MVEFNDKVIVVTGGAGDLGRAVAARFHGAGATVAILDLKEVAGPYWSTAVDLIDPKAVNAAVGTLTKELGRVDVLAAIAGGFAMGDGVVRTSDDTYDFMMNVNARTALNAIRAIAPSMIERKSGKIVTIGARPGLQGVGAMGAYGASKSVVMRLTESLSEELKSDGVNVNCILPSIIDTPRNRADMPDADHSRWVRPEAIADVIAFLASPAADPIHGALLPVYGLS